jgi:NAD(P)-dependent dehydrogenase (short-subunit alcohol dehydrogenase family)
MPLDGKTVLITGSTDGVGRCVALHLAERGAQVLVHGRSPERGEALLAEMRAGGNDKARLHIADFSSLSEVRKLARDVAREYPRLHLLINNAGIGSAGRQGRRETSREGYELRFAVNYLAGFLLTRLLLPLLRASAPARIVNVASLGQQAIDFENVMLRHGYDGGRAYSQSKLAQIMFTLDLARELQGSGVSVTSLHPATYMDTSMVRQAGVSPMSSVEEGAESILHLALSPALEGRTGEFYDRKRLSRANPQAYDEQGREQLRQLSLELTGLVSTPAPSA